MSPIGGIQTTFRPGTFMGRRETKCLDANPSWVSLPSYLRAGLGVARSGLFLNPVEGAVRTSVSLCLWPTTSLFGYDMPHEAGRAREKSPQRKYDALVSVFLVPYAVNRDCPGELIRARRPGPSFPFPPLPVIPLFLFEGATPNVATFSLFTSSRAANFP